MNIEIPNGGLTDWQHKLATDRLLLMFLRSEYFTSLWLITVYVIRNNNQLWTHCILLLLSEPKRKWRSNHLASKFAVYIVLILASSGSTLISSVQRSRINPVFGSNYFVVCCFCWQERFQFYLCILPYLITFCAY